MRRVAKALDEKGSRTRKSLDPYEWHMEVWREEQKARKKQSPEEKRYNEIKGGVITASVGLGLLIFLNMLFSAIASSTEGTPADILRAIPFVGLIPLLIGVGIIVNGVFISKRIVKLTSEKESPTPYPMTFSAPPTSPVQQLMDPPQQQIAEHSVTEPTTTKLREPVPVSKARDTK